MDDNEKLLHLYARKGFTQLVDALLNYGVNVNSANNLGETALQLAIENGHTETAALLLDKGADENICEEILYYAACAGETERVSALLNNRANVNRAKTVIEPALHIAFREGGDQTVSTLLNGGGRM